MGITFLLRKEGLDNIRRLNMMQINKIASTIAAKLCESFPELHLSQSELFVQLSRLDMYLARMADGSSAKYVYGNNTIYFNEKLNLSNMDIPAIHECIHYLQEFKDQKGKLTKLGLYDLVKGTGLAINEAAVQLLATRTYQEPILDTVTYYGMTFDSESPEYYPLECALLSQMTFFTGKEPLYFSTFYGSPMFERAFVSDSTEEAFLEIENNFDKLLNIETELLSLSNKLLNCNSESTLLLQAQIEAKKKSITSTTIKIQNQILESCFKRKFVKLETFDDIRSYEQELKDFKKYLILPENYTFYDNFCRMIIDDLDFKRDQIIKYGKSIDVPKQYTNYLSSAAKKTSKVREVIDTLKDFIWG